MNTTEFSLYMLVVIALRLAIPFGLTILVSWGLRRLDARWRDEASQRGQVVGRATVPLVAAACAVATR